MLECTCSSVCSSSMSICPSVNLCAWMGVQMSVQIEHVGKFMYLVYKMPTSGDTEKEIR